MISEFHCFNLQPICTRFGAARKCRIVVHQKVGLVIKRTHIPEKPEKIMKLVLECLEKHYSSEIMHSNYISNG